MCLMAGRGDLVWVCVWEFGIQTDGTFDGLGVGPLDISVVVLVYCSAVDR